MLICVVFCREYNFENKQQQTFTDEDIVNMYPIVKHISPRATDAYNFYTTGTLYPKPENLFVSLSFFRILIK